MPSSSWYYHYHACIQCNVLNNKTFILKIICLDNWSFVIYLNFFLEYLKMNFTADNQVYTYDPENISRNSTRKLLFERIIQIATDFIVIIIVFIIFICVYFLVPPKITYFTCNDSNEINYPYKDDTVAFWVVGMVISNSLLYFLLNNLTLYFRRLRHTRTYFIHSFDRVQEC
jgi:hypothetical protein